VRLPPGNRGLPWLGESTALLRNPFGFLEERRDRFGNVFRSKVLGREVAFLAGLEGAERFYDETIISRSDAHPYQLVDLFGGDNMEMFDGDRHLAMKRVALTAFDEGAIAEYVPDLQQLVESTLARLVGMARFSATRKLRRLAIEAICWNVMGIEPGPQTSAIVRDYDAVLTGLVSLPVPIPGTPYARARAARDRLLALYRRLIAERRAKPGKDGLSRMLAYTDDEALLEMHHIVIAGFIVYALMAEVLRRLAEQPALRERCLAEVVQHLRDGPIPAEALGRLQTSTNVVREAKRIVPLVPLAFGRALQPFTCEGYDVPEGWRVYLALYLNNHDPAIYADPARFDPDRFAPGRAEQARHPLAFIPQGAEPPTGHRCLGLDYSTALVLVFLTVLLRRYTWELLPQDLTYDWGRLPPEPRDGLLVSLR
jgi:cytochrome P450